jgi:hypothetical protein
VRPPRSSSSVASASRSSVRCSKATARGAPLATAGEGSAPEDQIHNGGGHYLPDVRHT